MNNIENDMNLREAVNTTDAAHGEPASRKASL